MMSGFNERFHDERTVSIVCLRVSWAALPRCVANVKKVGPLLDVNDGPAGEGGGGVAKKWMDQSGQFSAARYVARNGDEWAADGNLSAGPTSSRVLITETCTCRSSNGSSSIQWSPPSSTAGPGFNPRCRRCHLVAVTFYMSHQGPVEISSVDTLISAI